MPVCSVGWGGVVSESKQGCLTGPSAPALPASLKGRIIYNSVAVAPPAAARRHRTCTEVAEPLLPHFVQISLVSSFLKAWEEINTPSADGSKPAAVPSMRWWWGWRVMGIRFSTSPTRLCLPSDQPHSSWHLSFSDPVRVGFTSCPRLSHGYSRVSHEACRFAPRSPPRRREKPW
jgi:hypothetical protein